MTIRRLEAQDAPSLDRFLARIPEGDRTFFKENVDDPEVRAGWYRMSTPPLLAVEGGTVIGFLALVPLQGWSSHVAEVRVIVDPDRRGQGVGRALARSAVLEALELGLTKMMVEVVADQEPAIGMFRSLGFVPEALLTDHVRDHSGQLRDLMVLSHSVEESWGALLAAGIPEAL
jgi:L-amino acid N-acyltransferase YncA